MFHTQQVYFAFSSYLLHFDIHKDCIDVLLIWVDYKHKRVWMVCGLRILGWKGYSPYPFLRILNIGMYFRYRLVPSSSLQEILTCV
ncbi:hypothetical protein Hanom_Chr06g00519661 [Helianthus anomalus]